MASIPKRQHAVFTMAHNESIFLPIWLSYYSQYFAPQDIYVIEHNTTDNSVEDALKKFEFNLTSLQTEAVFNHEFMLYTVVTGRNELLTRYETVVYSDTDEFIIVDPKDYTDLKEFIESFKDPFIKCVSRSVIYQPGEPKLDLSKKILSQRSVWFDENGYDKVSVSRVPMTYNLGLHRARPSDKNQEYPESKAKRPILLHLARMDFELRRKRGEKIQKENWGAEGNDGYQQLLKGKKLKEWFYDLPAQDAKRANKKFLEKIPKRFKNII